jgi:hypothetical protein
MNVGRVMYQGSVEDVPQYFKDRSLPLPPNYNSANWIINVAQATSIKDLHELGFFPKDKRKLPDAFTDLDGKDALCLTLRKRGGDYPDKDDTPVGMPTQIAMLYAGEYKNIKRDFLAMGCCFGSATFMSLLIGVIFYNVGNQLLDVTHNLNSQFGALIMVMMIGMMGTPQQALLAFPQE